MNERIKELINEATSFKEGLIEGKHDIEEFDKEKFAELIVRECVAICRDIDGEDNIDAKSGRQDCAVEIKEHFGVEE
jgi:uncharacterized coiled-coil DUF342 family protein